MFKFQKETVTNERNKKYLAYVRTKKQRLTSFTQHDQLLYLVVE
jgi:hypothetical protein